MPRRHDLRARRQALSLRHVLAALALVLGSVTTMGGEAPASTSEDPLPLGTFVSVPGKDKTCPVGHTCSGFEVKCPGVLAAAQGFLARAAPPPGSSLRGVVMLFSMGIGNTWWTKQGQPDSEIFVTDLAGQGFEVVQVRWTTGWSVASTGETVGQAVLACRSATVIEWVHANIYLPQPRSTQTTDAVGRCGFCISGVSAGSSQVAYALSHYGLDRILDAVVPASGPSHADMVKGCMPGYAGYTYKPDRALQIDTAYGFSSGGPCQTQNPAWVPYWERDSIATGGHDFFHDSTRVHLLIGETDAGVAPYHAGDYYVSLTDHGSPLVTMEKVAGMGHMVQQSPQGLAALKAALLQESGS